MLENLEQQNWTNFCTYQLGDWHGTWTVYSPEEKVVETFKCIRSFRSSDLEKIEHTNFYIDSKKKNKIETFSPYFRPKLRGLYLDNSFSWGSNVLEKNLFFETGFRHQNQRVSLVAVYEKGNLNQVIAIGENLDNFFDFPSFLTPSEFQGVSKSLTPELRIVEESKVKWNPLKDLLIFNFSSNISLSCPANLLSSPEFNLTVDWLATPTLLYRGIRSFNFSEFKLFTLQIFTVPS